MALLSSWAHAQTYPVKSIRLIAPFSPGASTDVVGRLLAAKLTESWGQTVIVENRPGAGGIVGAAYVAKAPPDGYTLLMGSVGSLGTIGLRKNPPYDPVKDFAPITLGVRAASALVVHPSLPVTNVKQLIAFARAHPASSITRRPAWARPATSRWSFSIRWPACRPCTSRSKGRRKRRPNFLTGRSHIIIQSAVSTLAHLQSGRLRVLATTGSKRMTELPAVPTMIEAGLAGYEVYVWYGVLAPAGTSPEIVTRLNHELVRIFNLPDVKAKLLAQGGELATGSPAEFTEFIRNDVAKWNKVIRAAKMEQE